MPRSPMNPIINPKSVYSHSPSRDYGLHKYTFMGVEYKLWTKITMWKNTNIVKEARHLRPDRNRYSALRNKITSFLSHEAVIVVSSRVWQIAFRYLLITLVRRTLINSCCRTSVGLVIGCSLQTNVAEESTNSNEWIISTAKVKKLSCETSCTFILVWGDLTKKSLGGFEKLWRANKLS
jgi:hypothetical protein